MHCTQRSPSEPVSTQQCSFQREKDLEVRWYKRVAIFFHEETKEIRNECLNLICC